MRNNLKFAITSASLLINNNIYFHHKWFIVAASSTNDSNKPISLSKRKNLLNNHKSLRYSSIAEDEHMIGVPPVIIHGKEYRIQDVNHDRGVKHYVEENHGSDNNDNEEECQDLKYETKSDFASNSLKSSSSSNKGLLTSEMSRQGLLEVSCALQLDNKQQLTPSIKAFVDTGAQVSVISLEAANRCGLNDFIDFQYSGKAVGVTGSSRIVGRLRNITLLLTTTSNEKIHVICRHAVVIQDAFGTTDIDLLLGLDILSEFDAAISLRDRTLSIQHLDRGFWKTKTIKFVDQFKEDKGDSGYNVFNGNSAKAQGVDYSSSIQSTRPSNVKPAFGFHHHQQEKKYQSFHHEYVSQISNKSNNEDSNESEDDELGEDYDLTGL